MQKTLIAIAIVAISSVSVMSAARAFTAQELSERAIERRAVEAANWGVPAVNYDLMLQEMKAKTTAKENEIIYWSRPVEWHNQTLTPNPDAIYLMTFTNTKDVGPVVIDVPPANGGSLNGNIVNIWQMPLEDAGLLGADQGKGGKYLILPPGYKEKIPEGYYVLHSETYGGYALLRSNLASHSDADIAASVAYGKKIKVYPLSQAANPAPTVFTNVGQTLFDTTIRYDASFYTSLNRIIQSEPWLERDRAMIDPLRTLGIEKGKEFKPDAAVTKQLDAGIREARAWFEQRYDTGFVPFFEKGKWNYPANPEVIKAASVSFVGPDTYPVDFRGLTYTYAYVGIKRVGVGQFYLISIKDKAGKSFAGGKTYRLIVPAHVPVKEYWSLTAYDRVTHTLIRNMSRPSLSSQFPDLQKNADGSVDLFIGPKAPKGKETNWIPTDPKREFELMFRLYAPTKELFDKTWVLSDVELVK